MSKPKKIATGVSKPKSTSIDQVLSQKSEGSLNNLKQVTGQLEDTEPKYKKTSISQVLGDKGYSVYGTMEVEVYTEKINKMDKYDLNVHAATVNVFPHDNRQRLIKELISAFNSHVVKFRVPETHAKSEKASPAVQKILNQAK